MHIPSFDELKISLCEIAGVEPPQLQEDDDGIAAFTLELDGVATSLLQYRGRPDSFILASRLGAVAPADESNASRMLMESNFLMLGEAATPCVGRNPITGDFVLHFTYRLAEASGADVYQTIVRMTELAQEWRERLSLRMDTESAGFAGLIDRA